MTPTPTLTKLQMQKNHIEQMINAEKRNAKNKGKILDKIKALVVTNMITRDELLSALDDSFARKTVAAKYKGPNGELWSGRGRTPKWVNNALASGESISKFKI